MKHYFIYTLIILVLFSCNYKTKKSNSENNKNLLIYEKEVHFKNLKQLTFSGDNAEAYWSFDDSKLVFQAKNQNWNAECDQIFIADTNNYTMATDIPSLIST